MCQALPVTWPLGGDRPGLLWVTSSHPTVIQSGWTPRSTCGVGTWGVRGLVWLPRCWEPEEAGPGLGKTWGGCPQDRHVFNSKE